MCYIQQLRRQSPTTTTIPDMSDIPFSPVTTTAASDQTQSTNVSFGTSTQNNDVRSALTAGTSSTVTTSSNGTSSTAGTFSVACSSSTASSSCASSSSTASSSSSASSSSTASSSSSASSSATATSSSSASSSSTASSSSSVSSSSTFITRPNSRKQQSYPDASQLDVIPGPPWRPRRRTPFGKRQKIMAGRGLHLPISASNSVSANIPLPPNWDDRMRQVSGSLDTYKLFTVDPSTNEYKKLAELLYPMDVWKIKQILNPTVWTRFVNARKEMLMAKCNDPMVLNELGLSGIEIDRKQQSLNFFRHNALDAAPYSDNFAILFHCAKEEQNVEYIQRDGFDERMSHGGILGKGIYFSDNVRKSIFYDKCGIIFVCGVLLGDCLTNAEYSEILSLMREPEKLAAERRSIDDNYYDSVSATQGAMNQYAVYNRYQCYPMYKVYYNRSSWDTATAGLLNADSAVIRPPFCWPPENLLDTFASNSLLWRLDAKTVFEAMNGNGSISSILGQETVDERLEILKNLGFTDAASVNRLNKDAPILAQRNFVETLKLLSAGNAVNGIASKSERKIDETLKLQNEARTENRTESESEGSSYHSSTDEDEPKERPAPTIRQSRKKALPSSESIDEDCLICYDRLATTSSRWRMLPQCEHKLCVDCYKKIEITRQTMTGVTHTFIKCPLCLITSGTEVGVCPNGVMIEKQSALSCEGYEDYNTIVITYTVNMPSRVHMPSHSSYSVSSGVRRVAYLPDNHEGQSILQLLRVAWNRRIIFTIGTSHTTGQENALVWNIHHKTSATGGVSCYGYPDDTYLDRVRAELKSFGIE